MLNQSEYLNLVVRYLNAPQDKELCSRILSFRSESAENESYFKEMERIWLFSSAADRLSLLDPKQSEKRFHLALGRPTHRTGTLKKWISGIAASFLLIGLLLVWLKYGKSVEIVTAKTNQNQTDTIFLADGSKVILAQNSELQYASKFDNGTREVRLNKGKAFFLIAKDANRPFSVDVADSRVSVLGTSFNVNLSNTTIDIDVKTGRVQFSVNQASGSAMLTAGRGLSYSRRTKQTTLRRAVNPDSWLTKHLIFVDAPLEEVCRQVGSCYGVQIRLKSGEQTSKKLNGTFEHEDLEDVLKILEQTYNLKIDRRGDEITIEP
ncbi:FecR family protein [Pedobacter endophyticus]|uniref:FecR domain-containing protein n=1 Tax=Pedobacter endophyticus TaxID=2789740 RepID=A0A7U3Q4N5_9SPHI|nr:FecR domain-containing protein [Pedobacter endophyticus]QPH38514.1 FecR domain-containing protein [Pedobacter endophyticus]